jgi:hypothetical protein
MIIHNTYPSVSSLRAAAQVQGWKKEANGHYANKYLTQDRGEWLGIEGGAPAALAALVDGYPRGEQMVREFHDNIAASLPRAVGVQRRRLRGAMGDELDIHAVNRGNVDRAWSTSSRAIRRGSSILRLVVDICANGDTSASSMQWRGVAGLALSEVMSKAGYSVEIVAAFAVNGYLATSRRTGDMTCTVVVKPRGVQADLGMLAATVALPAFFRTLGFCAIIRCADNQGKIVSDGLGHYLDVAGVLPVPDKVTQLMVPQSITSHDSAVQWVRESVALLQGSVAS